MNMEHFSNVNDNRKSSTWKQSGHSATLSITKFTSSDLVSNLGLPYQKPRPEGRIFQRLMALQSFPSYLQNYNLKFCDQSASVVS